MWTVLYKDTASPSGLQLYMPITLLYPTFIRLGEWRWGEEYF